MNIKLYQPNSAPAGRTWIAPWLFFIYVTILFAATALFQDGLFERDGYYHARYAQLMPERGLSQSFPWTQLSTWRDSFCDKEFLYHALMMPWTQIGNNPILGARLFALLLSVAVIVSLYFLLRHYRCRWPLFFTALPFAAGGLFIARLGMIRSHVLSMALLMLGMHLLLKGRWRSLFVLGFVYAWSYTMPFVLVMTAVPFVIGRWLGKGGLDWKSPVAAGSGSLLGLVIHPYFPLTFETLLTYVQVFRIGMQGTETSGVELGNEIYPYSFSVFLNIYPLLVILVPVLIGFVIARRKKITPETFGVFAAAFFWFCMTAASPRFVEYSVMLIAIVCSFTARDTFSYHGPVLNFRNEKYNLHRYATWSSVILLLGFHIRSMQFYVYYQSEAAAPRFFKNASQWMEKHLPPGETVINLFWDDFPDLFYDGARQRYIWGLDPTYSIRLDYDKTIQLERFRRHQVFLDGVKLSSLLNSKYLILRTQRVGGFPELGFPPFQKVYGDSLAAIYYIP